MTDGTAPVRVRFAPSPTGFLHIGGVRTALFNWLFARHHGGQFILRLEDTDEKRFVAGAANDIVASLRWVGLNWDEGHDVGGPHAPYIQSQRHELGIYQAHVEYLLKTGWAYKSFVTPEAIEEMKTAAMARGVKSFRFRGPERDWSLEQMAAEEAKGTPYTVRLKVPTDGVTEFHDLVRGGEEISIENDTLYDIVLLKSSGMPVYHLAHLVDDHLMEMTHIIRGEEWVPSTPYHIILYHAFGWRLPIFAHVPNILRQDGRGKLSKRKDDVATNRFWERGYLPEALRNYLALQGWSYDDRTEMMTLDELIERFTIDRVQASPARWNPDKLLDMNGKYIRMLAPDELAARLLPFLSRAELIGDPPTADERAYVRQLVPLVHERLKELSEAPDLLVCFLREIEPPAADLLIQKKMDADGTRAALEAAAARLEAVEPWDRAILEETLRVLAEALGLKTGQLFGTIRVAATGSKVSPPLDETLEVLGRARALQRIRAATAVL
ncbi:MAG: glutamate--tRNA ligase [Chloroflexaceae bacterium]|nr:glutamate--tRNA ligase [Chloroflexaceae bacterium]NJO04303.1 glutamate--tRNA ligase [Chloroflexaceae bacterium]